MPKDFKKIGKKDRFVLSEWKRLPHKNHPKLDYYMLFLRNFFVVIAVLLFLIEFLLHGGHDTLKAVAYFIGAVAYVFECLAATDCFKTKVSSNELFMVYCFGPLYILMRIDYMFF